jgi:NAD(P)-dependent dehydrogenase (short-subunit alcohol dehydrogenase family)
MKLSGRVALVTGGTRGIGRGCALLLAEQGADIVLNYSQDEAAAARTTADVARLGRRVETVKADVGDLDQLRHLLDRCDSAFGRVDVLVSNAGIGQRHKIVDTTDEEWERVMNVDARATFVLARALLPGMIERRFGRIVTISSIIAKTGVGGSSFATYAAAKAALIALTFGIAREGAPYVTANAICPGVIDRNAVAPAPLAPVKWVLGEIPLQRRGTPGDIAETVLFLATGGGYMTGQSLNVNGGLLMQ